jgi:hypothetical protein
MNSIEQVFGELQYYVSCVKLAHLGIQKRVGSYATHIALGDLYDELADLSDTLIESYQGKYGVLQIEQRGCITEQNVTNKLKAFAQFLEEQFHTYCEDTWVLNQIDEITRALYHTIYKLETFI